MSRKRILAVMCASCLVMVLLLYWIYDFELTRIHVSNVLFILGLCFFFPGLFLLTGAGQFFSSATYLTKKMFSKPEKMANHLKSYNDFLVHRNAESQHYRIKQIGKITLAIGGVYIVLSLIVG